MQMTKEGFPWLALGIGLVLAAVLIRSGAADPADGYGLPLLTLLLMAEFGFLVTAVGAFLGVRTMQRRGRSPAHLLATLGCAALALGFLMLGFSLWPGLSEGLSRP
jgi:hypothetical protein